MPVSVAVPIPRLPPIVPYLLLTGGAYVAYAAIRNISPAAELRGALAGSSTSSPPISMAGTLDETSVATSAATGGSSSGPCPPPPPLVALPYNPGLKVTAATAAAFTKWVAGFGKPIIVSNSYRTCESQASAYAGDPIRYGSAGGSAHPKGLAVDVNLQAMGISFSPPAMGGTFNRGGNNAQYVKLWTTGKAAGFSSAGAQIDIPRKKSPSGKDSMAEPWHFSYSVFA